MAGKSLSPPLSDIQKTILKKIILRRDSPQHLVRRVRIVLLAAEGYNNKQIAPQDGHSGVGASGTGLADAAGELCEARIRIYSTNIFDMEHCV